MRKKGENSIKRSGKACGSARRNNDFILGIESQSVLISLTLTAFCDCSAVEPAPFELIANQGKRLQSSNLAGPGLGGVRGKDLASREFCKSEHF
jgi:hypothetical protein